jgi:hypothetical protein
MADLFLLLLILACAYFGVGYYVAKTKVPAFTWEMVLKWPLLFLK